MESFLAEPWVEFLPAGYDTCRRYGQVAESLRRLGTQIPQNDIWVAAHSLETGADLLTFDSHFEHVPGLSLAEPPR
ncbi:MAG: type II toxin-antitoxin system VapC family toxin [Polyangia bacterium]